jgi:PHD/YefM family antitoxin component YafN of YafNO toxin-antitoxin module
MSADAVARCKHGSPAAVLLSVDDLESMEERRWRSSAPLT